MARAFFLLGERLEIDWLEGQLEALAVGTRWQRWAQQSTEDELFAIRRQLCEDVLAEAGELPDRRGGRRRSSRSREDSVARVQRFMRSLAMEGVSDLAQLTVALRQLRSLSA